jgi:ATP-dependent DNA helicase RecQ
MGFPGISTWGLMKEHSHSAIMDMMDFLTAENLIQAGEEYGSISFTERSMPFLKNKTRLMMRRHEESLAQPPRRTLRPDAAASGELPPDTLEMFEVLRRLRRDIASAEGVPPYVVFSDKTLLAMCEAPPSCEEEFLSVPGVGRAKLEKYGARFLDAIDAWVHAEAG